MVFECVRIIVFLYIFQKSYTKAKKSPKDMLYVLKIWSQNYGMITINRWVTFFFVLLRVLCLLAYLLVLLPRFLYYLLSNLNNLFRIHYFLKVFIRGNNIHCEYKTIWWYIEIFWKNILCASHISQIYDFFFFDC